jgi:undecaprenyl-diphosphatase
MAARMPRLRPVAWQVILALALSQIVIDGVVKPIVGRARPFVAEPTVTVVGEYRPSTYSFPSGHASQSFAAAVVLASALPRRKAWWFLLAASSRFRGSTSGVHYPLDVAVGVVVGLAWSRDRRERVV